MRTKEINTGQLPKTLWKFYVMALRPYWWMLALWAFFVLAISFDRILQPLIQKWVVNIFQGPVPAGYTFVQYATLIILLITGLNLAISACGLMRDWIQGHWITQAQRRVSEILTDYVHRQSMTFWMSRMPGQIKSQMNYISDGYDAGQQIWMAITRILTLFINGALLFQVNYTLALAFMGILIVRVGYAWAFRRRLTHATKERSSVDSKLSGKLVDSLSNYSLVKLFARRRVEEKHLAPVRTEQVNATLKQRHLERIFWWVPGMMLDVMFGAILGLCAWLYIRGVMNLADVVFTTGVYFSVMGTIGGLIETMPGIIEKLGAAHKAYEELIVPIEITDAPNAPTLNVTRGDIEFKNVSFKYRGKRAGVLDNFDLHIRPGERVGVVGASGAGKTTLVNLLMRFFDPRRGEITIDGQNIRNVTQDSLRKNIAFIPQESTMFNRTLRENIAYGAPNATDRQIRDAARQAAADEFIMATPKKYNSMVGDRGIKLSGGQRQRIAIARAFLKNAPILILDEATSALDSQTEVAIQKSFEELARGRTTIAIAHRLSTLRNMDRIIVLKNGRIVESGTHNALLRRGGEYARLWKLQSGGFLPE